MLSHNFLTSSPHVYVYLSQLIRLYNKQINIKHQAKSSKLSWIYWAQGVKKKIKM